MLYELAKRLKDEGLSAAEVRAKLLEAGATKEECDVLLGSLELTKQPMTEPPALLAKVSRLLSSRRMLALVFLGVLVALSPVIWLAYVILHGFSVGR